MGIFMIASNYFSENENFCYDNEEFNPIASIKG